MLADPIELLRSHMYSNNLGTNNDLKLDSRLHRYSTKGTGHQDEWYSGIITEKGVIFCTYGTWRGEQEKFKFTSKENPDPECLKEYKEKKDAIEKAIKENQTLAYEKMSNQWNEALDTVNHSYLDKKKIKPHNTKVLEGNLLIPLYDVNDTLVSFCRIFDNGDKRHFTGISLKDGFTLLGNKENKTYYFAEGFATGASIHEATGYTVIVCHGSANILNISKILKNKFPEKTFTLCQDLGNAGDTVAEKFKKLGSILKPTFKEEHSDIEKYNDFNDIHTLYGLQELKKQISNKLPSRNLKEFFMRETKKPEWLCENLIMEHSCNFIYGASGVGKSFFTYDLALCIFSGIPFMNRKTTPKKILLIDGEMSDYEIKDRLLKYMQRYKNEMLIKEPNFENFNIITNEILYEHHQPNIELYKGLLSLNDHIENADVIILDNIESLLGDHPTLENASWRTEAWKPIEMWIKFWLMQNKTFIMVDHTNKSDQLQGSHSKTHVCQTIINIKKTNFPNPEYDLWFDVHIEKGRHIFGLNKSPWSARLNLDNTNLNDEAKKAMEGLKISRAHGCWEISPVSKKSADKNK